MSWLALTIHVDGRKHTTLKRLPAGRRFFRIPREVLRMKWEEPIQLFSKSGLHDGTLKAIPFRTIQPVAGAEIVRRIFNQGQSLEAAATAFGFCERTIRCGGSCHAVGLEVAAIRGGGEARSDVRRMGLGRRGSGGERTRATA